MNENELKSQIQKIANEANVSYGEVCNKVGLLFLEEAENILASSQNRLADQEKPKKERNEFAWQQFLGANSLANDAFNFGAVEMVESWEAEAQYWKDQLYKPAKKLQVDIAESGGLHKSEEYISEALLYFEKAASLNFPDGMWNLGKMYWEGMGVKQDKKQSLFWWDQAATLGHIEARAKLFSENLVTQDIKNDKNVMELVEESTAKVEDYDAEVDYKKYIRLKEKVSKHFDLPEIQELCFDMNIDFENLPGQRKIDKVRELIQYCLRRGRLQKLLEQLITLRPKIDWEALV